MYLVSEVVNTKKKQLLKGTLNFDKSSEKSSVEVLLGKLQVEKPKARIENNVFNLTWP